MKAVLVQVGQDVSLRQDRQHGNSFIMSFEEGRKRMEQYIKTLEREITKRRQVIELLNQVKIGSNK